MDFGVRKRCSCCSGTSGQARSTSVPEAAVVQVEEKCLHITRPDLGAGGDHHVGEGQGQGPRIKANMPLLEAGGCVRRSRSRRSQTTRFHAGLGVEAGASHAYCRYGVLRAWYIRLFDSVAPDAGAGRHGGMRVHFLVVCLSV